MNYEQWTGLREYTPHYHVRKRRKSMFIDFLIKLKAKEIAGNVLDAGCYKGDVCNKVSELGFAAYGIDAVKENIKEARKKYPKCDFRIGELGQKLPYPDGFFDVIWAGDVIEHVYDTITLFSEFNRILKKDGYFIVSTPMHNVWKMFLITAVDLHKHFHPEHKHVRFYTIKNFRMILKKYGFAILKEYYLGRIPPIANNMLFVAQKKRTLDFKEIPDMMR